MKITNEQIRTLLSFVAKTSDTEISCETCESRLAQFAESQLAGHETSEGLRAIEEHLKICPECAEELEYIGRALNDEQSNP